MSEVVAKEDAVGRLLLPVVKISAASSTKQLEKRFNYLWQAAHASIATCAPAAHQMMCVLLLFGASIPIRCAILTVFRAVTARP